jgi:hypothetical protein
VKQRRCNININIFFGCESGAGEAKEIEHQYKHIFGCEFGVLIHHRTLWNAEWNPVENRFISKLGCWRSNVIV